MSGKRKLAWLAAGLVLVLASCGCTSRKMGVEYAQNIILENDEDRAQWTEPRQATELIAYRRSGIVGKSATVISNNLKESAETLFMPINIRWKDEQISGGEAINYVRAMYDTQRYYLLLYTPEMMVEELRQGREILPMFEPVAMLAREAVCFAVRSDSPYTSLESVRAAAQAGRKLVAGGCSVSDGIDVLRFVHLAGLPANRFEYRTVDAEYPVLPLLDGTADVVCMPDALAREAASDGRIRVIASSAQMDPYHCLSTNWLCLLVPQNLTESRIEFWNETFYEFSGEPVWKETCMQENWMSTCLYGDELDDFLIVQKAALLDLMMQ